MEGDIKQDSITVGTPAKGGAIKMYFDETNAEQVIRKAKQLYYELIEKENIKKSL